MAKAAVPVKFYDAEISDYNRCPEAKTKVTKYLNKIDKAYEKGIGLYLYGGRGLGKSYLEAVIVKHALRKGYTALYTTLSKIVSMFGDAFYDKNARSEYEEILQVKFLVVDDIDKTFVSEKNPNYVISAFDNLFRTRSNELLPTIISSNQKKEQLFAQSDFYRGALSLLAEHLLEVTFMGKDRRVEISPQIKKEFFENE